MYTDHMWWGGMWMFPSFIFFLALILVPLYLWQRGGFGNDSETPLEILKKRYARGDITKDQFEQIKKDIS